jgi:hypothetical protein
MGSNADIRRRWLGVIFLGIAVLVLIAGETVWNARLRSLGFLVLWLVTCLVFTCLAVLMALLEVSAVRRRTREEQRALLEDTIREIARQKEAKSGDRPEPPGR